MKSPKILLFLLSLGISLQSCNQETSKSENNPINKSTDQTEIKAAWNASGDWVKIITQSDSLVIRNKKWGMDMNLVNDPLELAESQPAVGKSYSLYFDDTDLNFVDITYLPNEKGQLSAIHMDIFVEESQQVIALQNSFKSYFDVKFGESVQKGKKITWGKNKNTQVELEDVSKSKDLGIKIILKAKP
jgi:hypothetical protein